MGSFLLSNHWKASYSLGSFLLTAKLPGDWKAPYSQGSFPFRWEEESLFTGMLLPPGKLFIMTKLLTLLIFNRSLHSLYHLLGKDALFTSISSCLWLFRFTTKFFEKVGFFPKFPGKSKKFPGTLEYPEYPLLKGKVLKLCEHALEKYIQGSMKFTV